MVANKTIERFEQGATVKWESKRGRRAGQVYSGVVMGGPKGKHDYYEVSTPQGQFKVPAVMLTRTKVARKDAVTLSDRGKAFQEKKARNSEARDAALLRACQNHLDIYASEIARGRVVENRGVPGWPQVVVHEVDREAGKVKVDTSKVAFDDILACHGVSRPGVHRKVRTVWVLANRLYPVGHRSLFGA